MPNGLLYQLRFFFSPGLLPMKILKQIAVRSGSEKSKNKDALGYLIDQ